MGNSSVALPAARDAKTQLSGERPVRIQLRRTKGWRMPPNTVKVDRATKWGNPFSMAAAIDWGFATPATCAAVVVDCFRAWLPGGPKAENLWQGPQSDAARAAFGDLSELRGKNLACWCRPGAPCHADVLLELANGPLRPQPRDQQVAGDRSRDEPLLNTSEADEKR